MQVLDVSRASRNVRWIRYGARIQVAIAIGFCVLSIDFVFTSIDPNVYSYRVPEERGLAVAVFVLALVSATTSLGLLTARPMAAIARSSIIDGRLYLPFFESSRQSQTRYSSTKL